MKAWLTQHHHAWRWAWQRLLATPFNSLLTLLAIGITLALPAGGQMLLGNLQQLGHSVGSASTQPQLTLFLTQEASRTQRQELDQRLGQHAGVALVRLVTREETYKRMQADPGLKAVLTALPDNPYPDAFIISPRDDSPLAMEALRDELKQWPAVDTVQLDATWVRRLAAMLELGHQLVWLLALLLGAGLIAILFTTLRLQILARRSEIEVCQLLGANAAYIRRPFHYLGMLQGLAGGLVAWGIVWLATLLLRPAVAQLATLYDLPLSLQPLPLLDSLVLLAVAAASGWLAAALSLGHSLRQTR